MAGPLPSRRALAILRTCLAVVVFVLVSVAAPGREPLAAWAGQSSRPRHRLMTAPLPVVWVSPGFDASTLGWGESRFAKLQDGVNGVREGGTVNVSAGTYVENVVVSKPLRLIGAGVGVSILKPRAGASGLTIQNVVGATVSGISIRDGDGTLPLFTVERCSNVLISENDISNNGGLSIESFGAYGLWVRESHHVQILRNAVIDNAGFGVRIESSSLVTVTNNRIKNGWPIVLWGAWSCTLEDNTVDSRHPSGISLYMDSRNNIVRNNVIRSVANDGPCTPVRVIFSPNNLIDGNVISGGRWGIFAGYSDGTVVVNNTLTNHHDGEGIGFYHVNGGTIANNRVSALVLGSISLLGACTNNLVQGNRTSGGARGISVFYDSTGNSVVNNDVASVDYGLVVDGASGNTIAKNNVSAGIRCGYDNGTNQWVVGGVGNYWIDYGGRDGNGDGVGDVPYLVGPVGIDPAPRLTPFAVASTATPSMPELPAPPPFEHPVYAWGEGVWRNETKTLPGLVVPSGSELLIDRCALSLVGTNFQKVTVSNGASLRIIDSTVDCGGGEWIIENGATFEVRNSDLRHLGNWEGGGLNVYGSGAVIENCDLVDSLIPLQPQGTHARIVDNRIGKVYEGVRANGVAACTLTGNRLVGAIRDGIEINTSSGFLVNSNTVEGVWGKPIRVSASVGNTIHGNTFWSYRCAPTTRGSGANSWDDGARRGNYWADLLDVIPGAAPDPGRAGVWNTVYPVLDQSENTDRFPLLCRAGVATTTLPDSPTQVAPVDSSGSLAPDVTFSWYELSDAIDYRLMIATDRSFLSGVVYNRGDLTETTVTVRDLPPGTTYFWRVNGRTNECHSAWSPIWSFTTGTR